MIFFLAFIIIYSLIQSFFYGFYSFSGGTYKKTFLLFIITMVISPFFYNFFISKSLFTLASIVGFIGFTWMGVSFIFLFYGLIPFIIAIFYKKARKRMFYLSLFLTIFLVISGFINAANIKIKNITISTEKLPENKSFKIIHITDTHFDNIKPYSLSDNIMSKIKNIKTDAVVISGDIIDGHSNEEKKALLNFKNIPSKFKLAITGNHEFYHNYENSIEFIQNSGFKLLRGDKVDINEYITISGVDDLTIDRMAKKGILSSKEQEKKVVKNLDSSKFNIFLKHQPFVSETTRSKIDLQLSGHTHNGQIFPFGLITSLMYKYNNGVYNIEDNKYILVNSGTGFWGPPIRVFTNSYIYVIKIKGGKNGISY